jgi:hypothetical protein
MKMIEVAMTSKQEEKEEKLKELLESLKHENYSLKDQLDSTQPLIVSQDQKITMFEKIEKQVK